MEQHGGDAGVIEFWGDVSQPGVGERKQLRRDLITAQMRSATFMGISSICVE